MDERCCKKVYPKERFGWLHGYQCKRKSVVERNGKSFCRIHDPEYVEQKYQKRVQENLAKRIAKDQMRERIDLDRAKSLAQAYITELERALTDILEGNNSWREIKYFTGLLDERCKEIEALYDKITKKPEPF